MHRHRWPLLRHGCHEGGPSRAATGRLHLVVRVRRMFGARPRELQPVLGVAPHTFHWHARRLYFILVRVVTDQLEEREKKAK